MKKFLFRSSIYLTLTTTVAFEAIASTGCYTTDKDIINIGRTTTLYNCAVIDKIFLNIPLNRSQKFLDDYGTPNTSKEDISFIMEKSKESITFSVHSLNAQGLSLERTRSTLSGTEGYERALEVYNHSVLNTINLIEKAQKHPKFHDSPTYKDTANQLINVIRTYQEYINLIARAPLIHNGKIPDTLNDEILEQYNQIFRKFTPTEAGAFIARGMCFLLPSNLAQIYLYKAMEAVDDINHDYGDFTKLDTHTQYLVKQAVFYTKYSKDTHPSLFGKYTMALSLRFGLEFATQEIQRSKPSYKDKESRGMLLYTLASHYKELVATNNDPNGVNTKKVIEYARLSREAANPDAIDLLLTSQIELLEASLTSLHETYEKVTNMLGFSGTTIDAKHSALNMAKKVYEQIIFHRKEAESIQADIEVESTKNNPVFKNFMESASDYLPSFITSCISPFSASELDRLISLSLKTALELGESEIALDWFRIGKENNTPLFKSGNLDYLAAHATQKYSKSYGDYLKKSFDKGNYDALKLLVQHQFVNGNIEIAEEYLSKTSHSDAPSGSLSGFQKLLEKLESKIESVSPTDGNICLFAYETVQDFIQVKYRKISEDERNKGMIKYATLDKSKPRPYTPKKPLITLPGIKERPAGFLLNGRSLNKAQNYVGASAYFLTGLKNYDSLVQKGILTKDNSIRQLYLEGLNDSFKSYENL